MGLSVGQGGGGTAPAWLCTPEVKVLWHQKIFRKSSSFFQEPFRSSSPRSFMPKDLGGGGRWCLGLPGALCPSLEVWRELTRSMSRAEVPNSPHGRKA